MLMHSRKEPCRAAGVACLRSQGQVCRPAPSSTPQVVGCDWSQLQLLPLFQMLTKTVGAMVTFLQEEARPEHFQGMIWPRMEGVGCQLQLSMVDLQEAEKALKMRMRQGCLGQGQQLVMLPLVEGMT